MQTASNPRFVIGTFKKELKNRFLCEVQINGEDVVCYVPSSCHLSNFLQLDGKKVLLVPTQASNSRTPYALFAVPYKRNYIVLNTSMANRAIESSIQGKRFSDLGERKDGIKEHTIDGYKTDIYLPSTKTIVEIKSLISLCDNAKFPTVYSERTIKQLEQLYQLLCKGYRAFLIIVSLHPYVKNIIIDKESKFYSQLMKCLNAGLIIKAYTTRLNGSVLLVDKEIKINR